MAFAKSFASCADQTSIRMMREAGTQERYSFTTESTATLCLPPTRTRWGLRISLSAVPSDMNSGQATTWRLASCSSLVASPGTSVDFMTMTAEGSAYWAICLAKAFHPAPATPSPLRQLGKHRKMKAAPLRAFGMAFATRTLPMNRPLTFGSWATTSAPRTFAAKTAPSARPTTP